MCPARPPLTREQVVSEVAAAVGLDEGEAGVLDVLGVVARFEPVAVRTISRLTDLPIPISAAVCNELRRRDVVSRRRPVRLTPVGRALFADAGAPGAIDSVCAACGGRGIVVDASLEGVARELAVIADACPSPRFEIDQTHCTVDTKLRRVLALHESRALVGKRVLLLGDDDITSVAIKLVTQELGRAHAITSLAVVDVDPGVVSFVREALVGAPFDVEVVAHDLRDPLPGPLARIGGHGLHRPALHRRRRCALPVSRGGGGRRSQRPARVPRFRRATARRRPARAAGDRRLRDDGAETHPQLQRVSRRRGARRYEPSVRARHDELGSLARFRQVRRCVVHRRAPWDGAVSTAVARQEAVTKAQLEARDLRELVDDAVRDPPALLGAPEPAQLAGRVAPKRASQGRS